MDLTQWSSSGLLVVENYTMARSEHIPTRSEQQPPIQEQASNCPRCGHELGETALRAAAGQVRDESPVTGHELDLAPPGDAMSETQELVPAQVLERLREKAREFSSGEDDLDMKERIEESAFNYRLEKLQWGREAAAEIKRRQSRADSIEPDQE